MVRRGSGRVTVAHGVAPGEPIPAGGVRDQRRRQGQVLEVFLVGGADPEQLFQDPLRRSSERPPLASSSADPLSMLGLQPVFQPLASAGLLTRARRWGMPKPPSSLRLAEERALAVAPEGEAGHRGLASVAEAAFGVVGRPAGAVVYERAGAALRAARATGELGQAAAPLLVPLRGGVARSEPSEELAYLSRYARLCSGQNGADWAPTWSEATLAAASVEPARQALALAVHLLAQPGMRVVTALIGGCPSPRSTAGCWGQVVDELVAQVKDGRLDLSRTTVVLHSGFGRADGATGARRLRPMPALLLGGPLVGAAAGGEVPSGGFDSSGQWSPTLTEAAGGASLRAALAWALGLECFSFATGLRPFHAGFGREVTSWEAEGRLASFLRGEAWSRRPVLRAVS